MYNGVGFIPGIQGWFNIFKVFHLSHCVLSLTKKSHMIMVFNSKKHLIKSTSIHDFKNSKKGGWNRKEFPQLDKEQLQDLQLTSYLTMRDCMLSPEMGSQAKMTVFKITLCLGPTV